MFFIILSFSPAHILFVFELMLRMQVIPRRDLVTAKGKGVMRTYWLVRPDDSNKSEANELDDEEENKNGAGEQLEDPSNLVSQGNDSSDAWGMAAVGLKSSNRLVEWNVDVLYQLLTKVVTTRQAQAAKSNRTGPLELDLRFGLGVIQAEEKRQNDIEERAKTINIDPEVKVQLRSFVTLIASMYRDHPFHSFEHASHVMLSITKLLNRITNPPAEDIAASYGSVVDNEEMSNLVHAHTYGIASDALLQFSVAFAALIHDVDREFCRHDLVSSLFLSSQMPSFLFTPDRCWSAEHPIDKGRHQPCKKIQIQKCCRKTFNTPCMGTVDGR